MVIETPVKNGSSVWPANIFKITQNLQTSHESIEKTYSSYYFQNHSRTMVYGHLFVPPDCHSFCPVLLQIYSFILQNLTLKIIPQDQN